MPAKKKTSRPNVSRHIPENVSREVLTRAGHDSSAGITPLDLEVLSEDSSVDFLLQRTDGHRIPKTGDTATARTLAQHLDGLALAMELCAASIRARRCALATYLREWEARRAHLIRWHVAGPSRFPHSITITCQISLDQLTTGARTLFRILSWLAPEPMPLHHLDAVKMRHSKWSRLLHFCKPKPHPRALLLELCELHLTTLSADGTTFSVHPVLQDITRQQQDVPVPPALLTALAWVNDAMPEDTDAMNTWPEAQPLLPHALALTSAATERGLLTPTSRLLNCCAFLMLHQGHHAAAEPLFRAALTLTEKHLGANHPGTATSLNNLAQLLLETDRPSEAEPLLRRALAIDEAVFGHDKPTVAIRMNNLAQFLQDTNRQAEAEPLLRRTLAISENCFADDDPFVAAELHNLARLLHDTDRMAEAEPLLRRALAIDEAALGTDHPDVATGLHNLARLLHDTDRMAEAEPLLRRALAIDEAALGKDHPDVATSLHNLASLLHDTNRREEAEHMMRRALAIDEAALGKDHRLVATDLHNLAQMLQDMNRREEAEPMIARALRIFENSLGSEHSKSVAARNDLTNLRKEMQS